MKTVIFDRDNPKGIIKNIEINKKPLVEEYKQVTSLEDRLIKLEKICAKFEKLLNGIEV